MLMSYDSERYLAEASRCKRLPFGRQAAFRSERPRSAPTGFVLRRKALNCSLPEGPFDAK
eukprot:15282406-Alexandrium_andersonii.AAC.1